ncbi:MAG TPA: hypothetical protein VFT22_36065 [Kofleriaceae bacterium]|nr:hypothetical protein [Kofleriaceae bacterium]
MTSTDSRARCARLARWCAIGLASTSLAACVASGPGEGGTTDDGSMGAVARAIDPTGSWNVRYWFNEACDRPPVIQHTTLRVTGDPVEYVVVAPEASTAAAVYCTADDCMLSGVFTWTVETARFERDVELTLDRDGTITGSGTELVRDGAGQCRLSFTADGRKASPAAGS